MNRLSRALTLLESGRLLLSRCLESAQTPREPGRILVLGYNAIGDLIFFLPVLEGLRRRWPQARIVCLADGKEITEDILAGTRLCDEVWVREWESPPPGRRAETARRIKEYGFDLVILSLATPAHDYQGAIAGIPLRVGHCRDLRAAVGGPLERLKRGIVIGEFARRAVLNRPVAMGLGEHAVPRNLRLLEVIGVPVSPGKRPDLPVTEAHRGKVQPLMAGRSPVGIHLGPPASYNYRHWAPERYAELCAKLAAAGAGPFYLIGGPQEAPSAQRALRSFPQFVSLVGRLSLLETFAAIERCRLFIASDTGPAKAAMALGVPTVTVWGPSDPREAGIFWEPEKQLDIRADVSCSPCVTCGMAREGVLNYTVCGHHDCLGGLAPEAVYNAIKAKYPALLA
ncbi:MAG: glycosyltransferase family 9 protein [Elusimicrobia bacterium]|nr:glycosyltransferase family 9 protein [Elusimicrobiota bacterium]